MWTAANQDHWPDNKVLTALNAPIKPDYRQPKDFEEVEGGRKRPIAASYLEQRDGDQFVVGLITVTHYTHLGTI